MEVFGLSTRQAQRRQKQLEILHFILTPTSIPRGNSCDYGISPSPLPKRDLTRGTSNIHYCWSRSCEVPACITEAKAKCRWGQQRRAVREPAQGWDTSSLIYCWINRWICGLSTCFEMQPLSAVFLFVPLLQNSSFQWPCSIHKDPLISDSKEGMWMD